MLTNIATSYPKESIVGNDITASQNSSTNSPISLDTDKHLDTLLDDRTDFVLQIIFTIVLGLISGLFGTVTNIINIVIFIKQGLFSGGSTLNLFFLALADFGVCFMLFVHGIGCSVFIAKIPNLPIEPFSIIYLGLGWPHKIFMMVNRMLTAYVAFERCMCVVIPFRVKNIFAPKRTLVYLVAIFTYGIFSHFPIYWLNRIQKVRHSETNITKFELVFEPNREFWHDLVYYGNYMVISTLTIVVVVVCTIVTSAYVMTSKEWRNKVSSATDDSKSGGVEIESSSATKNDKTDSKSSKHDTGTKSEKTNQKMTKAAIDKEARLVKMITTISVIFCICYIPEFNILIVRSVDPRVNTGAQYARLAHILYNAKFVSAAVNSSINIFVYYRMSTKFRQIFLSYFGGNKEIR